MPVHPTWVQLANVDAVRANGETVGPPLLDRMRTLHAHAADFNNVHRPVRVLALHDGNVLLAFGVLSCVGPAEFARGSRYYLLLSRVASLLLP